MSDINKTYVFETVLISGSTSGCTSGCTSGATGPVTFAMETTGTSETGYTTYVGFGETNACKIRKIDTVSGSTYTAFWSNGEEELDKIWTNRYIYSYF